MKKLLIAAAMLVCGVAQAQVYVPGYVRSDGTYVQGHYRTAPNSTKLDNYSTRGNVNPYTGEQGTVDPYQYRPQQYVPQTYSQPQNPYSTQPLGGQQRQSSYSNGTSSPYGSYGTKPAKRRTSGYGY